MKVSTTEELFVLKLTDKHYSDKDKFLRKTYGDWGPDNLPTDNIENAIKFSSQSAAIEYSKTCGWSYNGEGLTPIKIKVKTIIEY